MPVCEFPRKEVLTIERVIIQNFSLKKPQDFLPGWELETPIKTNGEETTRWLFRRKANDGSTAELGIDKQERTVSLIVNGQKWVFSNIYFVDFDPKGTLTFLGNEGDIYTISNQGLVHSFRLSDKSFSIRLPQ